MNGLFDIERPRAEIAPGAVHLPGWLNPTLRGRLISSFAEWRDGPVPISSPRLPSGHSMSVEIVCLGWHWQPYRYTRTADNVNGAAVLPFPDWLSDIGRAVVADAYADPALTESYRPDTALVNFYGGAAKMGMHQDKDEHSDAPVVSLSIGDTCQFRFGNTENRGKPYTDIELASGDAFVFGGPSRYAYHGVPKTYPGTAEESINGRINITMRVTGFTDQ